MSLLPQIPQYAVDLVEIYGPPQRKPWGTAVFYEQVEPGTDLEQVALRHYEYFVTDSIGDLEDWLQPWQLIYQRPADCQPNFFQDLRHAAVSLDYEDRLANDLAITFYPDGESLAEANADKAPVLSAAFEAPEVNDFRIYSIGDGEVLEGIFMIAGRDNGEVVMFACISD
jgi:hypothetical protein